MSINTIKFASLLSALLGAASCASNGATPSSLTYGVNTTESVEMGASPAQDDPNTESKGVVGTGVDAGKGLVSLPGKALGVFSSDELPDLSAGTQELGLSGNLNFTDDTAYNADLSYGYFFKNAWQVGLTANAFGRDDFNFGAGVFTEYNFVFDQSKWVPYVGAAVKWARVSTSNTSDSSAAFTGELGVKYFIRSNVSIFSGINFDWAPNDVFGVGDELESSAKNLNFGLRFYL